MDTVGGIEATPAEVVHMVAVVAVHTAAVVAAVHMHYSRHNPTAAGPAGEVAALVPCQAGFGQPGPRTGSHLYHIFH